jgi:hypothetical protein
MPDSPLSFGDPTVISEIAHIVAQKPDGPRGEHPLPLDQRDRYDNLVLLCEEHHDIVDQNEHVYTVEVLKQMKLDHEQLIEKATLEAVEQRRTDRTIEPQDYVTEVMHSTFLPVTTMPKYIYKVSCEYSDRDEKLVQQKINFNKSSKEMYPFVIRAGWIYCFNNLEKPNNAFSELIEGEIVEREEVADWLNDPDDERRLQDLLNRALNKLTGRKGLNFDRAHKRYFFTQKVEGQAHKVSYKTMNTEDDERSVVWQPITKKTGLPKDYWLHRAAQLRFHRVAENSWCLSIRPGLHVSSDGAAPYPSDKIGKRVNKKMARRFNYEFLSEVHFWRDFLSEGKSPFILLFGDQSIHVESTLLQTNITWPGIPEEFAMPFTNANYLTDMFTQLELDDLARGDADEDDDIDDWERDV